MSIPVNPDATPEDEKNTFEKYIEILEYAKRVPQFPVTYTCLLYTSPSPRD